MAGSKRTGSMPDPAQRPKSGELPGREEED